MYIISKEFHFSASHALSRLPDDHQCRRVHGHNYVATMFFRSATLNETGFVIDYLDLDSIKQYVDAYLDHQHLNDILPFNPTAENLAKYLFDIFQPKFKELFKVEVSETPKTKAIYEID
ncbi:6-pyruvoyl trahydropterin synthase family protein [Microbacter margulisiae]|uniref:6-carboxy-5,6,7,8-tetrahydropterin synthase n=1 Tax=Microbacter margulisiae TaxID=1350067 RepID=A0A7W5DQ66_9PORP|nr:6-carboxytetrahydropterin synthase [Microbacter margulisiae]MBB3187032.1 6-pyruvoyltetrahydropterin/6-carboxytetrahydropterin synthase [Microbacter margulisiae]